MITVTVERRQPRLTAFSEPEGETALRAFLAEVPESLRVAAEKVKIDFKDFDPNDGVSLTTTPMRFFVSECDDTELEDAAKIAAVLSCTLQFPTRWHDKIPHDIYWPRFEEAAESDEAIYALGTRFLKTLQIDWLAGLSAIDM